MHIFPVAPAISIELRQGPPLPRLSTMSDPYLYPAFLGPYGENDALLERLMVEFLRDHVYWRRNVHPEDPPAIPTRATQTPGFQDFEARMRRELHTLSAALKRSVPFHSPRYMGHMVSDLLLPGLAAQMLALPYNPNNVSAEAAPVTIDLELKVGLQLARMLGFTNDPTRPDCALGHLTSGGTMANLQAIRLARALKAFPVALRAAAPPGLDLPEDDRAAYRLAPDQSIALLMAWQQWLAALDAPQRAAWCRRVAAERIEQLGEARFFGSHPTLQPAPVLAPVTAHYSWSKGMKMLGLGRDQLRLLPMRGMRLDARACAETLRELERRDESPLMTVAVLGSTEFGTLDPVHELLALREKASARGAGFAVHVDAAWGGYLATLLRDEQGGLRTREEVAADFAHFPDDDTYAALASLSGVDSVTVDPHKLGYLAYGVGAFICRDQRGMALLSESADYVFDGESGEDFFARFRTLGRYIPEGSKPGALAAAAYVTHRVMPLDHAHFGRLVRQTLLASEAFAERAEHFAREVASLAHVCIPYPPDSNLVCLAINPVGNRDLATANNWLRRLLKPLRMDRDSTVQAHAFFTSSTTLRADLLGHDELLRVFGRLQLDPSSLHEDDADADRLLILRHTLMNPFLVDAENGISYIDRYFDYLGEQLHALASPHGA